MAMNRLTLFPLDSQINSRGHLVVGGCDVTALASDYGTPLYVFDEATLRTKCREFQREFGQRYPEVRVVYACKAFINRALLRLLKEEGMGLDVVSGGEIGIAASVSFPVEPLYFHGNNKTAEELNLALDLGVGRIVVDNFYELKLLNGLALAAAKKQAILLRLTPGIDPHTHKAIATGVVDSKFGFFLGQAGEAVRQALALPNLELTGFHFHAGSLIFETEPYEKSIEVVLNFAGEMKRKYNFNLLELDVGGGYPVQYTLDQPAGPIAHYAENITKAVKNKCAEYGLPLPILIVEPGRAIVGQAGVALYSAGSVKDIPGLRKYVSVDGGMSDNIRPAIYGSKYEALIANRAAAMNTEKVTIAGKYCESGDILINDIELPAIEPGDIIAIPDSGAYCIPMSSNYNSAFKPAIIMVNGGQSRLIRRRETVADLIRGDEM
jgi:diaminopimelate decarboxylase